MHFSAEQVTKVEATCDSAQGGRKAENAAMKKAGSEYTMERKGVQCGVRRGGGPGADEAPEGVQDIKRDPRNSRETGRSSWKQNVVWKMPTTTRVTRAVT